MTARVKLIRDQEYPEMYRIRWGENDLSDMYNLSRAKNHLAVWKENNRRSAYRRLSIEATVGRT